MVKVTHICISMALTLSPRKYFSGKFCLSFLKNMGIIHPILITIQAIQTATLLYLFLYYARISITQTIIRHILKHNTVGTNGYIIAY